METVKSNANESLVIISDDDEPQFPFGIPPPVEVKRARSRSPINREVTFENQQAITIQREKKAPNDFFMPLINTYLDLDGNQEWASVNMQSNLQMMFEKIKDQFFRAWLSNVKYAIKWDETGIISDDSFYKIFEQPKEVLIKTDAMVRPRAQLISILLHVLIHLYLNTASKGAIKLNLHDENFRKIMLFLNDKLKFEISTFHKFIYSIEDDDYATHWYQCTGICQNYEPFHGAIRCTSIPDESQLFWRGHEEACGGQFFKIFEMSRMNPETQELEKKYARNVRYMFPKTRSDETRRKEHLKTKIQAREFLDLTEEAEDAIVTNLCDVIDLDASEYNLEEPPADSKYVTDFTQQIDGTFSKCPFCEVLIGSSRLASHFDKCRGFQLKVDFKRAINFSKLRFAK